MAPDRANIVLSRAVCTGFPGHDFGTATSRLVVNAPVGGALVEESDTLTGLDFKIELIPLAVQDVDRSVEFYGAALGWSIDHDQTVTPELRFVQVTPPGSACSICFGTGLEMMPEGSTQFIQVVVDDADAACGLLRARGVECSDVDDQPWGRFVRFDDPDGNKWALQQIVRAG